MRWLYLSYLHGDVLLEELSQVLNVIARVFFLQNWRFLAWYDSQFRSILVCEDRNSWSWETIDLPVQQEEFVVYGFLPGTLTVPYMILLWNLELELNYSNFKIDFVMQYVVNVLCLLSALGSRILLAMCLDMPGAVNVHAQDIAALLFSLNGQWRVKHFL